MPQPNAAGAPQHHPLQPLHFSVGRLPPTIEEREKDLVAQVEPPMMEKEMITMIVDTLPVFYYEKMVGYIPFSFTYLVFAGERIEVGLRRGKFDYSASASTSNRRFRVGGAKKEGDTHAPPHGLNPNKPLTTPLANIPLTNQIIREPPQSGAHPTKIVRSTTKAFPTKLISAQSRLTVNTNPITSTNPGMNFPAKKPVEFTPIPMPYVDLLPSLISNQMVVVNPGKIYQSPFPRWYNPNGTCAYHGGVSGHSIEQCMAFKHKVQSLIDVGWLTFQEDNPNVRTNPLTSHGSLAVNTVEEWEPRGSKRMGDVFTSRRFILEALREAGMILLDGDKGDSFLIHLGPSHNVETCPMAGELLQGMMDRDLIEVCSARKGEGHACMQSVDKSPSKPKPLVIHFTRDLATQKPRGLQPVLVKKPTPFPYKSDKTVSWKYAAQGLDGRKDASAIHVKDDLYSAKVTNISDTSGMTRSRQILTAPKLPVRSKDLKGKAKADVEESSKAGLIPNDEVPVGRFSKEEDDFSKKGISAKETTEFLRIIQQSELKVIEQLNKPQLGSLYWDCL
ncbi:hypothetical protein GmHk_17G049478 [Glycine max]|nr:hypothetical protein GmHk_17G049478 [Glycine max]